MPPTPVVEKFPNTYVFCINFATKANKQQQQSLFSVKLHLNIETGPQIAIASLGGQVYQDLITNISQILSVVY